MAFQRSPTMFGRYPHVTNKRKAATYLYYSQVYLLVDLVVQMRRTRNIQTAPFFQKCSLNRMCLNGRHIPENRVLQIAWIGPFRYSWRTKFISCASDTINLNQQTLFEIFKDTFQIGHLGFWEMDRFHGWHNFGDAATYVRVSLTGYVQQDVSFII